MSNKYVVNEEKVKSNLHIKALVGGKLAPECDPIDQSFTWAEGDKGAQVEKQLICSLKGWSRFGYLGFFKPSLGELICAIPDDLVKQVDYVEISNVREVGTNFTAGVHEFEFLIYKKAPDIEGVPV